ncbi:hypothetical protein FRC04_011205 [Tulasnella sp. 424]|nr:hypothetical protein FRC04_011205 [Tulasnella sp. 424]KAG8971739.1 hypothetical protein FRC05_010806 [Tulasnella sp. 425]
MSQGKERKSFFRKVFGSKTKEEQPAPPSRFPPPVSSDSIFKSQPAPPPPQTAPSTPPKPPFTFSGRDAEECKTFIRNIWQFAHQRAKESDERWKAGLAGFCMVGNAKEWYENELDAETRNNWDLLKVALAESASIPTTPANPPPCIEQQMFSRVYDFSQRESKSSFDPTIPTPAPVLTAEPSLPPSPEIPTTSNLPSSQPPSPGSPSSITHPPPSSPTLSIRLMKPIDLNKATEGYVRVITWNQQPVYLSRSTGGPGCFGPSANSLVASKMVFDPSDDTSGLKLRHPIGVHHWLAIAWSSDYTGSSQTDAAWIVASTAPTPYSGWMSCTLQDNKGSIQPFVWNIYPDGSIGVRYYDAQGGVYRRLTPVIIETVGVQPQDPQIRLVGDYDKFVSHHGKSQSSGSYTYKPARLVFQPR